MASRLVDLFNDPNFAEQVKTKLPIFFHIAEIESSRAGKIGMEVGSLRESILIAMLIYKFGEENVETNIPIIEPELDVSIFGKPISIKTITSSGLSGVKLSWTVDAEKAHEFMEQYYPECDILLAQVAWGKAGGLFYIPLEVQRDVLEKVGRENYIKLPKPGTNPRGSEIHGSALTLAVHDTRSKSISILWKRPDESFNKYERWIAYWRNE